MKRFLAALSAVACLAAAAPALAGVSGYLKMPDIDGESEAAAASKGVEVLDVKWDGATRANSASSGGALTAATAKAVSPPAAGNVTLTLPKGFAGRDALQRAYRSGAEIPVLEFATPAGDGARAYLKYKLERCFIKSWSTSGDADDRPTEEVAFYYNKLSSSTHSAGTAEIDFVEVGGGGDAGVAEIDFVETGGGDTGKEPAKPKRKPARKKD